MKADDFRSLSMDELNSRIEELRKELFNMRMQLHSNQITNTNSLRELRANIARALTVQSEKQISEAGN
jgi:large subunit ribosomal protein L29